MRQTYRRISLCAFHMMRTILRPNADIDYWRSHAAQCVALIDALPCAPYGLFVFCGPTWGCFGESARSNAVAATNAAHVLAIRAV